MAALLLMLKCFILFLGLRMFNKFEGYASFKLHSYPSKLHNVFITCEKIMKKIQRQLIQLV